MSGLKAVHLSAEDFDECPDCNSILITTGRKMICPSCGILEIERLTVENATIRGALNFDRLLPDVILLDGKYYRMMTDEECAEFIWKPENEGTK